MKILSAKSAVTAAKDIVGATVVTIEIVGKTRAIVDSIGNVNRTGSVKAEYKTGKEDTDKRKAAIDACEERHREPSQ